MRLKITEQIQKAREFDKINPLGMVLRAEKYCLGEMVPVQTIEEELAFEQVHSWVKFASAFMVIFTALFLYFNWSAYSLIAKDWMMTNILGNKSGAIEVRANDQKLGELMVREESVSQRGKFLASVGLEVNPPDMRLEIPGVVNYSVPVVDTSTEHLVDQNWLEFEKEIQGDLKEGVVHYPYTAYPGEIGNVFITGHSSYYPWDSGKYKDVFALLSKLKTGDHFSIFYQGKKYNYQVFSTKEVKPSEVDVLTQPKNRKIATLMTCVPVGTTLRRLIVQAEQV